jgi:hypothetical protein
MRRVGPCLGLGYLCWGWVVSLWESHGRPQVGHTLLLLLLLLLLLRLGRRLGSRRPLVCEAEEVRDGRKRALC